MQRQSYLCAMLLAGVTTAQKYDYMVLSTPQAWGHAEAECSDTNEFGGHIASVEDEAELAHLENLVAANGGGNFWIGGRRTAGERNAINWEWIDGKTFTASPNGNNLWNRREPNDQGGDESCLVVAASVSKYNDARCNREFRAVCKRIHQPNPYIAAGWKPRNEGFQTCYHKYFDHVVGKRLTTYKRKSWDNAAAFCRTASPEASNPGALVTLDSEEKNDYIRDQLTNDYLIFENRPVWMGLKKTSGQWHWPDGSEVSFDSWQVGEPNNKYDDERCGQMNHAKKIAEVGDWNDAHCQMHRGYICEACSSKWTGALALRVVNAPPGTSTEGNGSANAAVFWVGIVAAVTLVSTIALMSKRMKQIRDRNHRASPVLSPSMATADIETDNLQELEWCSELSGDLIAPMSAIEECSEA